MGLRSTYCAHHGGVVVSPCSHPPLDDFDVRGVARLCDLCLLRLHEIAVGPPSSSLFTGVPNHFRTPAARERAIAQVVGCIDPTPEEAHRIAVAAGVVWLCTDVGHDLEYRLSLWYDHGTSEIQALDELMRDVADFEAFLAAVDRVVEVADA